MKGVNYMLFDKLLPPCKIHMIGIGGVSMSGLAEILKNKEYIVTGSDINSTHLTDTLIQNDIPVFFNHDEKNVVGADAVIYTAAIKKDNPEYLYAQINNIPLIERSVLLGEITKMFDNTIAIAGTHGKTTTTSMLSVAFLEANMDPTISVGGELPAINSNYKIGNSEYFLTEACEYVESFLTLSPHCAIILNVEEDHLDYYKDINHIISSFNKFADKIDSNGYLVINNDDTNCANVSSQASRITFGIETPSRFMAKNINMNSDFTEFDFVENDTNNEYYVMMAKAWLISICYIKYKDITLDYLKKTNIDKITYNKTISKICDSKRVSINDKIMLKKMKK
jgi:UDP-N-acetylmuramate--alanine ligase